MRRSGTQSAEIVHRLDQAAPKEVGPDPVDEYAMEEGIGGRDDGLGPFQTATALRDSHRFGAGEGFEETALNRFSRIFVFTPDEDAGGFWGAIGHGQTAHRIRQLLGSGPDRSDEGGEGFSGASPVQKAAVPEGGCKVEVGEIGSALSP